MFRGLLAQRYLAVLLCAATLLLKLIVPTGYMIGSEHGRVTIELCSGGAPQTTTMSGMHGGMPDSGTSKEHGKPEIPCAFTSLSAASLAAIDPIQLTVLIAFIEVVGLALIVLPATPRSAYIRPPLRGPPAVL